MALAAVPVETVQAVAAVVPQQVRFGPAEASVAPLSARMLALHGALSACSHGIGALSACSHGALSVCMVAAPPVSVHVTACSHGIGACTVAVQRAVLVVVAAVVAQHLRCFGPAEPSAVAVHGVVVAEPSAGTQYADLCTPVPLANSPLASASLAALASVPVPLVAAPGAAVSVPVPMVAVRNSGTHTGCR